MSEQRRWTSADYMNCCVFSLSVVARHIEQLVSKEGENDVGCIMSVTERQHIENVQNTMFEKCITLMVCLASAIRISWLFMWNGHSKNRMHPPTRVEIVTRRPSTTNAAVTQADSVLQ